MKCPKCGYHSFDYLENCKKCGQDLTAHKAKYNLHGFFSPHQPEDNITEAPQAEPAATNANAEEVDFGFDFLDEEETAPKTQGAPRNIDLDMEEEDINLAQPFGIDSETVPADQSTNGPGEDETDRFEF